MQYRNLMMIALAAALSAATLARAEPFNERGEDFIAAAPAGSAQPRAAVAAELGGYNERGGDYRFSVSERTAELASLPRLAQADCVAVCSIE